jgi:hypothetical protein
MANPYAYMDSLGAGLVGGAQGFIQGQQQQEDRNNELAMHELKMQQAQSQIDQADRQAQSESNYRGAIQKNFGQGDIDSDSYANMAAQLAKSGDPRALEFLEQSRSLGREEQGEDQKQTLNHLAMGAKFALSGMPDEAQKHFDASGIQVKYKGRDEDGNHTFSMVHPDDGQEHEDTLDDDQVAFLGSDPQKFLQQYITDQKNKQAAEAKQADLERKQQETEHRSADLEKRLATTERIANSKNNTTVVVQDMKGEQAKEKAAQGNGSDLTPEALDLVGQLRRFGGTEAVGRNPMKEAALYNNMAEQAQKAGQTMEEFAKNFTGDRNTMKTKLAAMKQWDASSAPGSAGAQIVSFNTYLGHLKDLEQEFSELKNGQTPAVNKVKNAMASMWGQASTKGVNTVGNILSDEVSRLFAGKAITNSESTEWHSLIDSADSPQQQAKLFHSLAAAASKRLKARDADHQRIFGNHIDEAGRLDPENMSYLRSKGISFRSDMAARNKPSGQNTQSQWQDVANPTSEPQYVGKNPRFPRAAWSDDGASGPGWYVNTGQGRIRRVE